MVGSMGCVCSLVEGKMRNVSDWEAWSERGVGQVCVQDVLAWCCRGSRRQEVEFGLRCWIVELRIYNSVLLPRTFEVGVGETHVSCKC